MYKTLGTLALSMTYTDQVNPGQSYDPLLILLVRFTSIIVNEGVETIETWIEYVCHSEGKWASQNI